MTASQQWVAPPLPAGPRRALIVATTEYADAALRQLRSPAHDAAASWAVLEDAGGFEVQALADASAGDVRGAIADFTAACGRDDLALVYLARAEAAATPPSGQHDLVGVRLLWVDDNPGSNEFLVQNFTARGAIVYPAMTTNQAVQLLGELGFDALISDISRNGKEVGFDDLTRIRAAGYAGPAIFFTSRTTPELRNRAKKSGADGIVSSDDELSDWLLRIRAPATPREPQSGFFARMREAFNDS